MTQQMSRWLGHKNDRANIAPNGQGGEFEQAMIAQPILVDSARSRPGTRDDKAMFCELNDPEFGLKNPARGTRFSGCEIKRCAKRHNYSPLSLKLVFGTFVA